MRSPSEVGHQPIFGYPPGDAAHNAAHEHAKDGLDADPALEHIKGNGVDRRRPFGMRVQP
jgi:hypothetical protein